MNKLLISLLFFVLSVPSSYALKMNQITFVYEPYDGAALSNCQHHVTNPTNPYDLTVTCVDKKGAPKRFNVHLALSRYTHPTPPKLSYELLYWVNDNGATTWFHFNEETPLNRIESSQSLIGESAGLRLSLKLI